MFLVNLAKKKEKKKETNLTGNLWEIISEGITQSLTPAHGIVLSIVKVILLFFA